MLFDKKPGQPMDFTRNNINIDTLCDAFIASEEELGRVPTFKIKKEHQKLQSEKTCNHECDKCHQEKDEQFKNHPYGALMRAMVGIYDDDDDDFFMCDKCTGLSGYKKKYDAAICDACTLCETCDEYLNEECSGCSYSTYRDGMYYRDKVDISEILSPEDIDTLKEIENGEISARRLPMERFRV